MNYLLPVTSSAVGRVPHCEFEGGVLIEDTDLEAALAALNSEIEKKDSTQWDGVTALRLRPRMNGATTHPAAPADVTIGGEWFSSSGYKPDEFLKAIREILVPAVKRPIVAYNGDKKPRLPMPADGRFHLFVGFGQRTSNTGDYAKIYGIELGNYSKFAPEGTGRVITDPETATPVFQVEENAAWLLINCAHQGGRSSEHRVFRKICEELAWEVSASPEQKAERVEREAHERRKRSRESCIAECSRRFDKTLAGTREAIERGHVDVRSLQDQLVRRIRETTGAERKLVQLEASRPAATDGYGKEFDKLLAVPKVRDVQIADGTVKVFTDVLFCTDPRTKVMHEIGAFRIELYTSHGDVRWHNLTRKVEGTYWNGGANAPHVDAGGKACLGTMAEIIPELVANYEFAALAMVAIQFVESVNVDDRAGAHINKWPVVA